MLSPTSDIRFVLTEHLRFFKESPNLAWLLNPYSVGYPFFIVITGPSKPINTKHLRVMGWFSKYLHQLSYHEPAMSPINYHFCWLNLQGEFSAGTTTLYLVSGSMVGKAQGWAPLGFAQLVYP